MTQLEQAVAILTEFTKDVEAAAYGKGEVELEEAIDWPDLADTYRRAKKFLEEVAK